MSVDAETPAQSMLTLPNPLRTTPLFMHRIEFLVTNAETWYAIMREARSLYGSNWRSQSHVKRRLDRVRWTKVTVPVWFEVPDCAFASWCVVKLSVEARIVGTK